VFPVAGLGVGIPATPAFVSAKLPLGLTVHRDRYTDAADEKVRAYDKRRNASSPTALNAMSTKRSNAQCEQFNHADPDHQHGECYRVIVEPISFLAHDTPPVPASLIGPAGRATTFLTKG
jgi:hypothetical protein